MLQSTNVSHRVYLFARTPGMGWAKMAVEPQKKHGDLQRGDLALWGGGSGLDVCDWAQKTKPAAGFSNPRCG